jgi:hypothetical protein
MIIDSRIKKMIESGWYVIYKEGKGYRCEDGFNKDVKSAILFKSDAEALRYRHENNLHDIQVKDIRSF